MGIEYRVEYSNGFWMAPWNELASRGTYGEAKELALRLLGSVLPPNGKPPCRTRVVKVEYTEVRIFPDQEP